MSVGYQAVGWNRQKRIYDAWLLGGVAAYLAAFVGASLALQPAATLETLLIRAFGSAAFVLLHVTLSIGPLCRLDRRCLPLLYNRRHMGVTVFGLGLAHGLFALVQFHALGDRPALVSLLSGEPGRFAWSSFPFQPLGFAALLILFLMAATSHDFWLANLGAPAWKRLHMLVYAAYALLVLHVALGLLQSETSPWLAALVGVGLAWVLGLHLVAGWRERAGDRERAADGTGADGWVDACAVDAIPEGRARTVCIGGERVAVFRYDGKLSALSNACRHQNGPLGEGRVIDGCVTCPWHGYQYRPADGASPPPFTEKVATYRVRLAGERVQVHRAALAPGTPVEPAVIASGAGRAEDGEFFVGYLPHAPPRVARHARRAVAVACAAGLCVAGVFALVQAPFGDGVFEFGRPRSFTGVLRAAPAPLLEVERPGRADGAQAVSQLVLVAEGKHGFEAGALDGARVELRATPIHRDGATLLEVQAGSVRVLAPGAAASAPAVERLGRMRLVGEVVDSKCWLGVMKPGSSKVHRACAIRCLSGGIPPALLVREASGAARTFLLLDADGRTLGREVLPFVAVPVEVEGEVERHGELLVLRSDPAAWREL